MGLDTVAKVVLPSSLNLSVEAVKVLKTGMVQVYQKADLDTYTVSPTDATQKIVFRYPRQPSSFRDGFLSFTASATGSGGGGTYVRFSSPITSIIQYIGVYMGSTTIAYITDADILSSIYLLTTTQNWRDEDGNLEWGIANAATRNARAVGYTYCIDLGILCSLLSVPFIPLDQTTSVFRIEIGLNPVGCLESDYTTLSYSVTNLQWRYEAFTALPDEYTARLQALMKVGDGFSMYYVTHSNFNSPVIGQSITQLYPNAYNNYTGCLAVMRLLSNLNLPTVNDKFENTMLFNNFLNSVHKINNMYVPTNDTIDGGVQQFRQLKEYMAKSGRHSLIHPMAIASGYLTNQFVLGYDFSDRHPSIYEDSDEILGGINTKLTASNSYIQIRLASALSATNQLDLFLRHNACLSINANGFVKFDE